MQNKKLVRWPQLVIGVIVLLFAGIIYAWSILKGPFASKDLFSLSPTLLGLNFALTVSMFCIGGFISGLLNKNVSTRIRLIASALLLFLGFFITSQMQIGQTAVLFLAYGGIAGLGIGITYNVILSAVTAWYPDKKGFSSGILLMGFALNSLIIGKVASYYLGVPDQWRNTFVVLAIITAIVILISAFLIKFPPAGTVFPAPKAKKFKEQNDFEARDYTASEMVKRTSFWKLFFFFMLLASVGAVAIGVATNVMIDNGAAKDFAITLVGIISIFNGVGRITSGLLFDNIGRRRTQYITSFVAILAPAVVVLAYATHSIPIAIIGLCICYFSYGFAPTGSTAFVGTFYGTKNFALNLSVLNLILIPTGFASLLTGFLKDTFGSFMYPFMMLAGFSVIGLIINLRIKKP
jgi:MFS transporter, OFA family, oxalate/formate antiporter